MSSGQGSAVVGVDLPATGEKALQLPLTTMRRGWHPVPRLSLSSRFPLGLFRAWSWIVLDHGVLAYPAPLGDRPLPLDRGRGLGAIADGSGDGDFSGLRNYRSGDPKRSIHWKSLPKRHRPMVKQFSDRHVGTLWLDWALLAPAGTEARLSQLCRWVVDADASGQEYGLRLPGQNITPRQGVAHRHRCLRALALHEDR